MAEHRLRILQVNTQDVGGGAEAVAWNLFHAYRRRGHDSWLAVGYKRTDDPGVVEIPKRDAPDWGPTRAIRPLRSVVRRLPRAVRLIEEYRGLEDFRHPGTWDLLGLVQPPPDIVHCHNLHGGYFDLRALRWLSHQVPVVLTLHDAWLLSGHCSHSFDCERWRTGCGHCPDLTIYPALQRDGTAHNWRRKRRIYQASRLHIATPCRWLMNKVEDSILGGAAHVERTVIPNGVDLALFHPRDKRAARADVGLPADAKVLLFTANGIRSNVFKDYRMMQAAVVQLAERLSDRHVLFVALGEDAAPEQLGRARIQFVPYQPRPDIVARYYQAADIYVHAARIDTFPNTILEALACGTPVVATDVGGISEQIRPLESLKPGTSRGPRFGPADATGVLVAPGDADAMAAALERLLQDEPLSRRLSENASRDAVHRFDQQRQVEEYLRWYQDVLEGTGRALEAARTKSSPPRPSGVLAALADPKS